MLLMTIYKDKNQFNIKFFKYTKNIEGLNKFENFTEILTIGLLVLTDA